MVNKLTKTLESVLCAVLIVQLAGCGTLMYPERRGQRSGRIDVGVAVLDGIGLLFFLIPGIIAYAVDFSNGTIYLPNTAMGSLDYTHIKQVSFDPKHYTNETIEKIIREETGYTVKLDQKDTKISRMGSLDDVFMCFNEVQPGMEDTRIVLSKK